MTTSASRTVLAAVMVALGIGTAWAFRPAPPARAVPREAPEVAATAIEPATDPAAPSRTSAPSVTPAATAPGHLNPDGAGDEATLMAQLRALRDSDPERAEGLAREGNRRFPGSADAPERTAILIHALAAEGRSTDARGEAEAMVNRAPDSPWVREIEKFTGAHRHRDLRLNEAGELEYVDPPADQAPAAP